MLSHDSSPDLLVSRVAEAVRTLREQRATSLSDLAAQAGVSLATLSQLEAGRANPSIETLWAIARALGVPFSRLIEPPESDLHVLRAGHGVRVDAEDACFQARLILPARRRGAFEFYTLDMEPGPARVAEAHSAGVMEHLIVLSGCIRAGPVERMVDLAEGDAMTFRGDLPHSYQCLGGAARALLAMDYP